MWIPFGNQSSVTSEPRGWKDPRQLSLASQRTRGPQKTAGWIQHVSVGGLPLRPVILTLSPTVWPGSQGRVTCPAQESRKAS